MENTQIPGDLKVTFTASELAEFIDYLSVDKSKNKYAILFLESKVIEAFQKNSEKFDKS